MPIEVSPARPLLSWEWQGKPFSYTVTPEDREWFIRALWREGKPAETVGHVLLQRFALLASTGSKYPTLTDFLRAYCQPINPLWFPGGMLSEAFIDRASRKGDAAAVTAERERAQRRVIYSQTPINQVRREFVDLADKILYGRSSSPAPTADHFTMSFADSGDTEPIALDKARAFAKSRSLTHIPIAEGHKRGLNWFFRGKLYPPAILFGTTTSKAITAALLFPWGLFLWLLSRRKR